MIKTRQTNGSKWLCGETLPVRPGAFMFCERASGTVRFQVTPTSGGQFPIEEAASLLAVHCLVRGQVPQDYTVLILPREDLLDPVGQRAQHLLEAGRTAAGSQARLSSRQREVLDCVLRDLSNKEISALLHVSERTVKFHVSGLLAKFKVRDRAGLRREAAVGLLTPLAVAGDSLFGFAVPAELASAEDGSQRPNGNERPHRMPQHLRSA